MKVWDDRAPEHQLIRIDCIQDEVAGERYDYFQAHCNCGFLSPRQPDRPAAKKNWAVHYAAEMQKEVVSAPPAPSRGAKYGCWWARQEEPKSQQDPDEARRPKPHFKGLRYSERALWRRTSDPVVLELLERIARMRRSKEGGFGGAPQEVPALFSAQAALLRATEKERDKANEKAATHEMVAQEGGEVISCLREELDEARAALLWIKGEIDHPTSRTHLHRRIHEKCREIVDK